MSEAYIGEIRLAGFTFAPQDWAFCNGQLLSISNYEALFNLIGTTYGGDGVNTFGLPNLQSRGAIHLANGSALGLAGGAENVTLTVNQLPSHSHPISVQSGSGTASSPQGGVFAQSTEPLFAASANNTSAPMLTATGSNQSHPNLMPYISLNYIICLLGIYPSQT